MCIRDSRDAYRAVKENLSAVESEDPQVNIESKRHLGATGNLALDQLQERLNAWTREALGTPPLQ